jgi:Glycosyltransferase family 87
MPSESERAELASLAVAAAVFVSLCAALPNVWQANAVISDIPVYQRYGDAIERGAVPYRDFRLEYPPGALAAFAVPSLVTDGSRSYARVFALEMALLGLLAIGACFAALRSLGVHGWRVAAGLAPLALAPLLLGPLLLTRFDLYPAALAAAAVALLLAGRDRLGSGVLGAAIAVKLYPAVLLPLAVAWTWRRRGRREALVGLGVCLAVAALVFLPFFVLSPDGVVWSVRRQLDRPLQIESLGAAVLLALHHAAGMPLAWASSHGSQNLTGTVAVVAAAVTTAVQLAVLGFIWWRFARSATVTAATFVEACAAVVVAFVALGKVLSPQFLVWLLPLVGLLVWRRAWPALGLVVAACALTRLWFPDRYWRLVLQFDELASWLVLVRDLALVAILVTAVAFIARPAPARSP